jgi:hypothetical protein
LQISRQNVGAVLRPVLVVVLSGDQHISLFWLLQGCTVHTHIGHWSIAGFDYVSTTGLTAFRILRFEAVVGCGVRRFPEILDRYMDPYGKYGKYACVPIAPWVGLWRGIHLKSPRLDFGSPSCVSSGRWLIR